MKKFCLIVALVLGLSQVASAADISSDKLNNMGLNNLQTMSATEAGQVRGKGFVAVGGVSSVSYYVSPGNAATSVNSNVAVSHKYHSSAAAIGGNVSFAGSYSNGGLQVIFSGGLQGGWAK